MLKMLTIPLSCHNIGKTPGMNPGPPNRNNLELKATKAWAPQALSFRGFFCFPGQGLGLGEAFPFPAWRRLWRPEGLRDAPNYRGGSLDLRRKRHAVGANQVILLIVILLRLAGYRVV
jgi:hypothetical protein